MQTPGFGIAPCMGPHRGVSLPIEAVALGSRWCSCCLTHEHCLPRRFQQFLAATASLIAEISDLIKDLHVSADAAASANYGLSSVESGVYACVFNPCLHSTLKV